MRRLVVNVGIFNVVSVFVAVAIGAFFIAQGPVAPAHPKPFGELLHNPVFIAGACCLVITTTISGYVLVKMAKGQDYSFFLVPFAMSVALVLSIWVPRMLWQYALPDGVVDGIILLVLETTWVTIIFLANMANPHRNKGVLATVAGTSHPQTEKQNGDHHPTAFEAYLVL